MELNTTERALQQGFKLFNKFMLLVWRLGLGPAVNAWPEVGGRIMVLTHTGRKSGLRRRTPVNYVNINGDIYCAAGFGKISDWYRNLLAHPEVEVWLPDGWWAGWAEDVTVQPDHTFYMRQVLIASGYAARLAGIYPRQATDEELEQKTAGYRLIRIHLMGARTGPGGPGDLAYLWPLGSLMLLLIVLGRGRKSRRTLPPQRPLNGRG